MISAVVQRSGITFPLFIMSTCISYLYSLKIEIPIEKCQKFIVFIFIVQSTFCVVVALTEPQFLNEHPG